MIRQLYRRLENSPVHYALIDTNVCYGNKTREYGEIDLYAVHDTGLGKKVNILFFEMKTTDSSKQRHKAYKQLERIKRRFAPSDYNGRCFYFYVHYDADNKHEYKIERVKI